MKAMKLATGMSVVLLVIAASLVAGARDANSSSGKSAVALRGTYTDGPLAGWSAASKFILCKRSAIETTSDSQASGRSAQSQTSNKERCISMIDLLGIILFLAIIAAHFGLCCRGPYSKVPD